MMNEPSEKLVGQMIDLKCGHTQRPTGIESVKFAVHLEAAIFVKGKGPINSPQRSILKEISPNAPSIDSGKGISDLYVNQKLMSK